jgi:NitT/TauT family transport system substrate-binding protein
VATYFASGDYVSQNSGVVKRFTTAINKSLDYATAHPDAVRQIVTTYTKIDPAATQAMVLPYWSHDLNKASIDQLASLMAKYGLTTAKPDVSSLYAS